MLESMAIEKGFEPKLIKGDEVGDDDLILPIANMGAPTVLVEKLPNAKSAVKALRKMEELMGKKAKALIAAVNSIILLVVLSSFP